MSGNLVFQAAVLRAGKVGIIKPDAAGYYEQCIGGLDIENAGGVTYVATKKAKDLFSESSDLQRRIRERALRGEMGHPRRGPEHANNNAWLARLNDIYEPNICVYWAKIELDLNYGRDNPHLNRPNMIGIIARFRPGGAMGHVLERDLADPEANVSFSIRSFSTPFSDRGRPCYELKSIVTWDAPTEPGLFPASKTMAATLESRHEENFSARSIREAVEAATSTEALIGNSVVSNESRSNLLQLQKLVSIDSGISKPVSIYHKW